MKSFAVLAAVLSTASCHSIMNRLNNLAQGDALVMPTINNPQEDVTSNNIACNGSPNSMSSSNDVITVKAGDTITGAWLHTLTSTGPDSEADNKVIASSHKGPVMAYMKKVDNAANGLSQGPGNGWFKISEAGLISPTQWAVDALIAAGGIQSVTIPTCIENGDYLLRFEIIALHNAYNYPGAQLYMSCAQIKVTGGTGTASPATVAIPGVYSSSDPGIHVNIYGATGAPYPASYSIPGPAPLVCGANSGPAPTKTKTKTKTKTTAAATSTKTKTGTKKHKTKTAIAVSTPTAPAAGIIPAYGQCGGTDWEGSGSCESGYTCKVISTYYSQCAPS